MVTGLTAGTSYTFTATATNSAGTSAASATSNSVIPTAAVVAPGTPGAPSAVAGNGQATVTISPPNTGGTPTSYTVTASPGGATCTVTVPATSCTVTGLTNGTAYTFTSVATNTGGSSAASSASSAVTPSALAAPGVPGAPTAVAGNGQATITISPPGSGGAPASYTVTASPGGATCTVTSPATSCVIGGLTNGTYYTFTSTATNAAGTSAASAASAAISPRYFVIPSTNPSVSGFSSRQVSIAGAQLTIYGSQLDKVLALKANGQALAIVSKTFDSLVVTIPAGAEGLVSLVFTSSEAILTVTNAFNYVDFSKSQSGNSTEVDSGENMAQITGFIPGSSVLTKSIKSQILALVEAHKTETVWSCAGFSQGPTVLRTDAALAIRRAKAACSYLKSLLPAATVSASLGDNLVELGALYRRVEISWG